MPSEERWLPLFPLNTVLFPRATLPLQIFEERYQQMLDHCLKGDSKLGIVLIKAGAEVGEPAIPYSTGTMAHIAQVNRVREGRFFIAVVGQQRFQIKNITQYRPFIGADVELLDDSEPGDSVPDEEVEGLHRSVNEYARLLQGLRGGWVSDASVPSEPASLSYYIADMLLVDLKEKQALLEQASASSRLDAEKELLERETRALKRRVSEELRGRFSEH